MACQISLVLDVSFIVPSRVMNNDKFFQLLRLSIGASTEQPVCTAEEWQRLFHMSRRQALLSVMFRGVERCTLSKPERHLLLNWFGVCEQYRERNRKTNEAAVTLTRFFAKHGYRSCILKGQGNTLYYPDAYMRTSGDIDIWVDCSPRRAISLARKYRPGGDIRYHHVAFKSVGGIETELHFRPSFMHNPVHNVRMQRWFRQESKAQFAHQTELPDGAGTICVPTDSFNRIYQMSHLFKHFIHEGIGMRQFVDYYYLLMKGFTSEERWHDEQLLRSFGLFRFAQAVMHVLQEALGLPEEKMLVPSDKQLGNFLLDEILHSGNFGQYDKRSPHFHNRIGKNLQRLCRDFRLMWQFPSECLWEPFFRWYHFFWRHFFWRLRYQRKG